MTVNHPKKWWAIFKDIYKNADVEDGIPPIKLNGNINTNNHHKAGVFNIHLIAASSVNDDHVNLPYEPAIKDDNLNLNRIKLSSTDVEDQIKLLDVNKAFGPDGLQELLKKVANPSV